MYDAGDLQDFHDPDGGSAVCVLFLKLFSYVSDDVVHLFFFFIGTAEMLKMLMTWTMVLAST